MSLDEVLTCRQHQHLVTVLMRPTLKAMSIRTVDYRVKGKVQGVYFRVFAKDLAQQHGIVGWVRNDQSGDVIGTAQGSAEALEKFKEGLHRGPPQANVAGVEYTNEAPLERPQFQGFEKIKNQRS
ncbi:Acylphosphatase-like domain-containing protein [Daedaleopsis nitida]|nr:Acylphosphatase-like domain-containing protein [Daedaleopsis nitida]